VSPLKEPLLTGFTVHPRLAYPVSVTPKVLDASFGQLVNVPNFDHLVAACAIQPTPVGRHAPYHVLMAPTTKNKKKKRKKKKKISPPPKTKVQYTPFI
jgi:hypothetical protein